MRRIGDTFKKQPMRWRRGRNCTIVACRQQIGKGVLRPAASRDINHSTYQEANHMVQKSIRLDREVQSSANPIPRSISHCAFVLIGLGRGPANGETEKLVLPEQRLSQIREDRLVRQRPGQVPFITAPEGRGGLSVRPDLVDVSPRDGAVTGVKLIGNVMRVCNPDIWWEQRVERSAKFKGVPRLRNSHVRRLSSRVNPSICPSSPEQRNVPFEQAFENVLDDTLNRYRCRLTLPSGEPRPVVLQHELDGALPHEAELTDCRYEVKQSGPHNSYTQNPRKRLTNHDLGSKLASSDVREISSRTRG